MVSKAFQVLSDPQKRAIYDQSGSDPEDRSGGMRSPSGFSSSRGGGGFEGEMSPEDLFNMFFGGAGPGFAGNGFGGGFGGGPGTWWLDLTICATHCSSVHYNIWTGRFQDDSHGRRYTSPTSSGD